MKWITSSCIDTLILAQYMVNLCNYIYNNFKFSSTKTVAPGKSTLIDSAVFFNIVQTAFDSPPPPTFWTCMLQIFLNDFQKSA